MIDKEQEDLDFMKKELDQVAGIYNREEAAPHTEEVAKVINTLVGKVLVEETEKESEDCWTQEEYNKAVHKAAKDIIKIVKKAK